MLISPTFSRLSVENDQSPAAFDVMFSQHDVGQPGTFPAPSHAPTLDACGASSSSGLHPLAAAAYTLPKASNTSHEQTGTVECTESISTPPPEVI
eukprot:3441538-Rhodomonas_salina.3